MLIIPTAFIAMKIWINHDTASVQGPAGEAAAGGGQLARWPPARNPQEWAAQVDKVDVIFATSQFLPTFHFYVSDGKFRFSREYTTFTFQRENTTFTFSGTMRRLTSLEPEHATAAKKYICDGRNVLMMKEIHVDRWKSSRDEKVVQIQKCHKNICNKGLQIITMAIISSFQAMVSLMPPTRAD